MRVSASSHGRVFVSPARAHENAPRLYCFPHAGGSATFFYEMAQKLAPEIECVCVQLRGRGARLSEAPHTSISEIACEVTGALTCSLVARPFYFFGHSFGGVIAFEVIKRLRLEGRPQPDHLFVGAAPPPQDTCSEDPLHHLPEGEFIQGVQRRYAGIPSAVLAEPEVLRLLLPALRADLAAFESYQYQPADSLSCPITAFVGAEDPVVGLARSSGWRRNTSSSFETILLPGGHFFPRQSTGILTGLLAARLANAGRHIKSGADRVTA
jgi:surfactin synthase thioesterase subunit